MISIARYIKGASNAPPTTVVSADCPIVAALCATILDYIGAYVFAGEFVGLRPQLEEPRQMLGGNMGEPEAAAVDESVRAALFGYSRAAQETLQKSAVEMQQMVGVLGHALAVLSGGSDRSASRFQAIQETLQRTSAIQDVGVLRASLRDVVRLIGEESSKEQQTLTREREAIETHMVRFRDIVAGNPNRRLRGREAGIRALSDFQTHPEPDKTVWIMAFVCENLRGIVQRYGPEVTDDLFLQLIRERIYPIAPNCSTFRWSPSAVVCIAALETDQAGLQSRMAALNQAPLVCRLALGNRTAMVRVGLSHLLMDAFPSEGPSGSPVASDASRHHTVASDASRHHTVDWLIAEIDRFTCAEPAESI